MAKLYTVTGTILILMTISTFGYLQMFGHVINPKMVYSSNSFLQHFILKRNTDLPFNAPPQFSGGGMRHLCYYYY